MNTLLFLSAAALGFVLVAGRKREPVPAYVFKKEDFRALCFGSNPQMTGAEFEWLWASLEVPKSKYLN